MLEYFYKEKRTLVDFRRGPLGPLFDGFARHLKESGYSQHTCQGTLGQCCVFNAFLIEKGITRARAITPALADTFVAGYVVHIQSPDGLYCATHMVRRSLRLLFEYLTATGIVKPVVVKPVKTLYSWMLNPYLKYLREECQLSDGHIQRLSRTLTVFLQGLKGDVARERMKTLGHDIVEAHFKSHLKDSQENLRCEASALRGFLRFCALHKYTAEDLSIVIPSLPRYRLSSLPRGMEDSDIQKILNTIDPDTPEGARDYAIMLLLMAYGIRAKQAALLTLDDINWPASTIRIRELKGGKEVVVPLLEAVGEALLRFLQRRPDSIHREVFLAKRGPHRPLSGLAISAIVRRAMLKAHVHTNRGGSSTLRHSWAIRALAHDSPIKAIADVLGHRCIDTTFIYAKADLKTLRQVAMPWPGRQV
jgi:integrase/recombinase XerD